MGFSNYWYLIVHIPYLALLLYASMNIQFDFYLKSHSKGPGVAKRVAITFDDGPHPEHTRMVLDILDSFSVKATFFCIGKNAESHPDVLKCIDEKGHIIGNHSYVHQTWLDFMPPFVIKNDLLKTNQLIIDAIEKEPLLFRPPFGVTTPSMALALKSLKMECIGWNNRSFDTIATNELIMKRIMKNLKSGDIILLHDILPKHKEVLPRIIRAIKDASFEIVPLDQLLDVKAYA